MTVYVDNLREFPTDLKYKKWCHMVADTSGELDAFAANLGLKPSWKSNPLLNRIAHYDLIEGKRIQALRMGAKEITDKELVILIRKRRNE